ncbi:MAG: shikimate kinase [Planctomycetes bacterium]|nr:shikimate kinase [Planctomycetota bacterium]
MTEKNIVLIGMAGVGKSTVGVLLAKATARPFVDTDVMIQSAEGRTLQEIINTEGLAAFARTEERHILAMDLRGHVIATGGSVVYSEAAMRHLKASGVAVHLDLDFAHIERRVADLYTRGLVMQPGQTLRDVYRIREPLYRQWADLTVHCDDKTQEQVAEDIILQLKLED